MKHEFSKSEVNQVKEKNALRDTGACALKIYIVSAAV